MCGRATLTYSAQQLAKKLGKPIPGNQKEKLFPLPNYNVAPSQHLPVVLDAQPESLLAARWGLIPFWAKDEKIGYRMINARIETVDQKNAFKRSLQSKRCLVPFDSYYEWSKQNGQKIPFRIRPSDQDVFYIAGIWDRWKKTEETALISFSLITQPASRAISDIHDRMPAILTRDFANHWIDPSIAATELLSSIEPYPDDQLEFYRVSQDVNHVRANHEGLIEPFDDRKPGSQLNLFDP